MTERGRIGAGHDGGSHRHRIRRRALSVPQDRQLGDSPERRGGCGLQVDPPARGWTAHDHRLKYLLDVKIEGTEWSPARIRAGGSPVFSR